MSDLENYCNCSTCEANDNACQGDCVVDEYRCQGCKDAAEDEAESEFYSKMYCGAV